MRRGFVDTPDGQVYYVEQGSGEPLVLLHQSPRSVSMWLDAMPLLAARHRVIAFDLLGYGESDPPPIQGEDADVAAMGRTAMHLLDALDIPQAHLVGHHTGAYIAAHAAVQGASRWRSLMLFGYSLLESDSEYLDFFARQAPMAKPLRTIRRPDGSHLTTLWMAGYAQVQKQWLLRGWPNDPAGQTENQRHPSPHRHVHMFLTEHELDVIERYVADYPRARYIPETYKVMIAPSADLLRRITVPTRVVDMESPQESSFCRRGDRVARLVPGADFRQLVGYDDNIAEFAPDVFTAAVFDFTRQHPLA